MTRQISQFEFYISVSSASSVATLELSKVTLVTVGPTPGLPIAFGVQIELAVQGVTLGQPKHKSNWRQQEKIKGSQQQETDSEADWQRYYH